MRNLVLPYSDATRRIFCLTMAGIRTVSVHGTSQQLKCGIYVSTIVQRQAYTFRVCSI